MEGGDFHGLSLDPFSPPHDVSVHIMNQGFNKWLGRLQNETLKGKGFLGSISTHFRKIHTPEIGKPALNKVVIDYKYFNQIDIAIGQETNYFKNYIDNILNTHFSEYSTHIIKLNY